jgi:signal transduction histidine kinase
MREKLQDLIDKLIDKQESWKKDLARARHLGDHSPNMDKPGFMASNKQEIESAKTKLAEAKAAIKSHKKERRCA